MPKENAKRSGCKDVFHAFLIKNAFYEGDLEIPAIKPEYEIPNKMISFSKSMQTNDFDQWVHFYEDDFLFERVWNNPRRYLERLKKFRGVITPDFSLYRDMPLVMQQWNTFRGKALGHWWQSEGIVVLPNVRAGDERSYLFFCDGIKTGAVISIGSHGCLKTKEDRYYFKKSIEEVVKRLRPSCIVVYGPAPKDVFSCCFESGIKVVQYESEIAVLRNSKIYSA